MRNMKIVSAVCLSALFALPIISSASEPQEPIEKLISELADKPAQHAAVAKYYRERAEEAKKEVEQHKKMKNAYPVSPKANFPTASINTHCDNLIKAAETEEKEYEQLAAEHEALAKK